jgi:hypothetical protein
MTESERALLLKFATSYSRVGTLGFKGLYPSFQIHLINLSGKSLPSASTW